MDILLSILPFYILDILIIRVIQRWVAPPQPMVSPGPCGVDGRGGGGSSSSNNNNDNSND